MRRRRKAIRGRFNKTVKNNHTYIYYRSCLEYSFINELESNPDVISYQYETLRIPYTSGRNNNQNHNYIPDFLVEYKNKTTSLIEVKPSNKLNRKKVKLKAIAARKWCKERSIIYIFITEKDLKHRYNKDLRKIKNDTR